MHDSVDGDEAASSGFELVQANSDWGFELASRPPGNA
jgi:hypothetical protein